MTVYVGVDIAKELHYAAIMNSDGVVANPFSFENNDKGFSLLLSHLSPYGKESVLNQLLIIRTIWLFFSGLMVIELL